MARKLFNFGKAKSLEARVKELEGILRSTNWDLKGEHLLDIIGENSNGVAVTQKSSMKFTGVLSAVSLRSELLASFPKMIYERTDYGRKELLSDPLYKILAYQPNPFMNAFTFWELVNTHLDLWGNAFVFISRYGGTPSALTPVNPEKVTIKTDNGKLIYHVQGTNDKVLDGDHQPSKFLHFKDISFDGIIGQSRISLAKEAIALGMSQEDFGKEFYDKGGHSKGIIQVDSIMGEESREALIKSWNNNANFGTALLEGGAKYNAISIPMGDAQFIASRAFQLQDVARVFRVPPHLLADLSRATFSNIEHSDIQFVKYGLRPMVKRYEHELELKLLGDDLGMKSIRFNLDGILRGDTSTRAQYYQTMKQNKIMTTNEIRGLENMNPIEGGDVLENPATSSDKSTNDEN